MTNPNCPPGIDPELLRPAAEMFADDDPNIAYNRTWFNIVRSHRLHAPQIARALRDEGVKDLIWYDIIIEIERAGPDGQLMSELEDKLSIAQYALSRHVSRLEKEGYVRREYFADGRRKQILFLTEKSNGLSERVWPAYAEAIQEALREKLSIEEAYLLTKLLIKAQL